LPHDQIRRKAYMAIGYLPSRHLLGQESPRFSADFAGRLPDRAYEGTHKGQPIKIVERQKGQLVGDIHPDFLNGLECAERHWIAACE